MAAFTRDIQKPELLRHSEDGERLPGPKIEDANFYCDIYRILLEAPI